MSTEDDGVPLVITPRDVFEERNVIQNFLKAFGIEEGLSADDSLQAAIVWNTARTAELLDVLSGDEGIEISPPELPDGFDLEQAIIDAFSPVTLENLYDVSVISGADILSSSLQPEADSLRVTVSPDTNLTLSLRVEPETDPAFTTDLNQGGELEADTRYEFEFDVAPDADYNFRSSSDATLYELRVLEVLGE